MNKKYYKYIFTFLVLLSSYFLCLNSIKATNFCDASNKLYCEYTISGVKVIYTIENGKLSSKTSSSIGVNLTSNLTMQNFKNSSENIYKCFDKLYFTSSMSGRTMNIRINASEQSQIHNGESGNYVNLGDSCNTFTSGYSDSKYACGIYGGMQLYSLKQNGKFVYSGTFTDKVNGNPVSFDTTNVGSVKGSVDSNGCPEELCYLCNTTYRTCNSASGNSNCYKKGSEILNQNEIENNQTESKGKGEKNTGDGIKATLGNAFKIANGTITCEGALGSAMDILRKVFNLIRIVSVTLLIILSMIDIMKAITAEKDTLPKQISKFVKRMILVVAIFMLPLIIQLILSIIQMNQGLCGL